MKEVLAGFKNSKSLGSDGWTVEFYIDFYNLLEEEILRLVEESRLSSKVSGSLNATFIALILKRSEPSSFGDFRPISLCNLIYKIIAEKSKGSC